MATKYVTQYRKKVKTKNGTKSILVRGHQTHTTKGTKRKKK